MNTIDKILIILTLSLFIFSVMYRKVPNESKICNKFCVYTKSYTDCVTIIPHFVDKVVYLDNQTYKFERTLSNKSSFFNFMNELKNNDPDYEIFKSQYDSISIMYEREFSYKRRFEASIFIPKNNEVFFGNDLIVLSPGYLYVNVIHGYVYFSK